MNPQNQCANLPLCSSTRITFDSLNRIGKELPAQRDALRGEVRAFPRSTTQISLILGMFGPCLLFHFQQKSSRKYIQVSLEKDLGSDLLPLTLLHPSAVRAPHAPNSDDNSSGWHIFGIEVHKVPPNQCPFSLCINFLLALRPAYASLLPRKNPAFALSLGNYRCPVWQAQFLLYYIRNTLEVINLFGSSLMFHVVQWSAEVGLRETEGEKFAKYSRDF